MKLKFIFFYTIIPILSFSQTVKVSTNGFWEDINGLNQKVISGEIEVDSLLIDQYHRTRVKEAIAYYSDGSTSNIEYPFGFNIGSMKKEIFLTFYSPKTNTKKIDSIVGKLDYFTPTIKNKSIIRTKYSKEITNKDLVKNQYPIKIILLDNEQIVKIKNDNIENQTIYFNNLLKENNITLKDFNYFVKHFFDDFPELKNEKNDFLFLVSDFNYQKFNDIKLIDSADSIIRICTEVHISSKICTWWYSRTCESCKIQNKIENFDIGLFFEDQNDIKTYNFKIENKTIQQID